MLEARKSCLSANAIFSSATVRELYNLATLAGSQRRVERLWNPSRSGITNQNWNETRAIGVEGAALAGGAWNPAVWLPLVGFGVAGGLLATPGIARALVRGGESRLIEVMPRRIGEVARRYPAAEQDLARFPSAVTGEVPPNAVTINPAPESQVADSERNPFDHFD